MFDHAQGLIALQIIATACTLSSSWLMGNKHKLAPAVGMLGDIAFFSINLTMGLWIIAPVCVMAFCIHARNFWKWNYE